MKANLYSVNKNVKCEKCGNKGAVQYYGEYHPNGMGDETPAFAHYEKYRNTPHLSPAMGFGGTIPHECLNCGNAGLIDWGGLEGYDMAFKTIKEEED